MISLTFEFWHLFDLLSESDGGSFDNLLDAMLLSSMSREKNLMISVCEVAGFSKSCSATRCSSLSWRRSVKTAELGC